MVITKNRGVHRTMQSLWKTQEVDASLFKRCMAFLTDMIIINFIVLYPLSKYTDPLIPKELSSFASMWQDMQVMKVLFAITMVSSIIILLYFSLLDYLIRQTPCKMILSLYVKSDKERLSFGQCILRSF